MNRFRRLWFTLQSSFWFVPSLIVAGSIVFATALIEAHTDIGAHWLARWPRLFGAGAESARGMLATIANSMITVVGVTFSMTLVALVMASSQYTSRILRNFMRDRVTQVVLGIFGGIFAYSLIVLRTIRSGDEGAFVPSLAVFFSLVLAMGGIGVLIFFIHHIADSIQASSIIASVADETLVAVDRLFPEKLGQGPPRDDEDATPRPSPERNWQAVLACRSGYIQAVDDAALLRLAREHKTAVRMEHGIGAFVVRDTPLASLALEAPADESVSAALQTAYSIDRHRTVEQDCAFGIRQIVDMALRALSPSVNDTTTAVMCVDYLTTILGRLAGRGIPSTHRYEDKELRVIAIRPNFATLADEAFDQIRGSANGNLAVMLRLLGALKTIASLTSDPSRRRVLQDQARWMAELAERTIESPHDRRRFEDCLAHVSEALEVETERTHRDKHDERKDAEEL